MGTLSKETGAVAGISQRQERYTRSAPAFLIILAALVLLLGFSMVLSVCTGIAGGSFKVFVETVMSPAKASGVGMIMLEMRMPRALAAGLTGMAFALSGAVMQGITRNPLSDAGLLGINAGAGFFVALSAILFPAAPDIVKTCAAFAGAALAVFMVYGFGAGKHRSESFRFILAGAAVSALLTALSQAVSLAFGIVKSLSFWSAGSLSGVTWQSLKMLSPVILSAGALGLLLSSRLSALALGEDSAASLGVNVRTVRLFGMLVVLLLAGASVSLVGGIAFIGLIVPHISRLLVGGDYRRLVPVSALMGGVVLVLSDIAARMINAPFDTPVGALVSILGVPVFLRLLSGRRAWSYEKKTRQLLILNGLLILIVAAAILSVNSGYARIPFSTAVHSIFQPHMEGTSVVVAQFRIPRIVLAVLCGMGLALAGCVMQTVTGNPLADPGILGINAGAGFAVMLFLTFFPALHIRTMAYQPIFAIAGGLCTTGLLYLFAKRNGKLLPIYFLLGGIGLASLFSSFMLIMAANMDNSSYQLVARWLAGNIWGTSWHQVLALLPYMLILVPFLLTKSNILDILLLGENTAISLGIAVERELRLLLIASVALTSACVAVSGGIGFVGLVAPHMARKLIGGRHHALMPASMLLGALLLLLADTLGRSAFQPREIPVGIVISVLSAPYFLFLLRRYF